MEENSELEEGEACYKDDYENIDPDIALCYIDKKIQKLLGHFQRDFEGGVSAENLGAKFGGYGSFLPTYERSPLIRSHPKSPHISIKPRSPSDLSMEFAVQNLTAPSNSLPFVRPGTASYSVISLHKSGIPSGDVSVKKESHLVSAQAAEKVTLKDESLSKSSNATDQSTLKVRIKVGCDNWAQKNATIYSGLGLDDSPSSSLGVRPEESGGILPVSQETNSGSPASILQDMTSFPVPGGILMSPLHGSLLNLVRKEKGRLPKDGKYATTVKICKGHSAISGDEAVSVLANGNHLNERKETSEGKTKKLVEVHGNGIDPEDEITLLLRRSGAKGILSDDLKHTTHSASEYVDKIVKGTGGVSRVPMQIKADGLRDGVLVSDLVKEDSGKSLSGQESGKNEKKNAHTGLVQKLLEQGVDTHKDAAVDRRDNGESGGDKTTVTSKPKRDLNVGAKLLPKQKVRDRTKFHGQDGTVTSGEERLLVEGKKKLKGTQNGGKAGASIRDSLTFGVGEAPKDKSVGYYVSTSKNTIQKMKSQQNINEVRDNHRDLLGKSSEQMSNRLDQMGRPSDDRLKHSSCDDFERRRGAFLNKSQERISSKKVNNKPISGRSGKCASSVGLRNTGSGLAPEVAPPLVDPVLIQENWVCCDSCQKWRLLPFGTKPEQLPEKWLCRMLNWLPGMNRCTISEEETTKALNALYQMPVAENQNNMQNTANETASALTYAHIQHLDQKHQTLNSNAVSNQGKKKYDLKEIPKAGVSSTLIQTSNSAKNHLQESIKSESLSDRNHPPAESNLVKQSSFHCEGKSSDFIGEKHIPKRKEKHLNGGDAKKKRMENKREVDTYGYETSKIQAEYGYETSKKTKTGDMHSADKHRNSVIDIARVGLSSSNGVPDKTNGKLIQKYEEDLSPVDTNSDRKKRLLISVKKLDDQAQASADGGSLDMRTCDKRDCFGKKRKFKGWQDNQDGSGSKVDGKEESGERGYRNEKKCRVSKMEVKESNSNNGNERSDKKSMVTRISWSGSREHPIDSLEELRNIDRDQSFHKRGRKMASQQILDGVDSLRRDFASAHVSGTATSSSSKVSGSHKTRSNFEEVKGSPVESVSSSPMRTSYSEKLASARGDILGKDDVNIGSVINNIRRCWDGEGDCGTNQSGTRDDADHNFCGQAKPSSDFVNNNLINGDAGARGDLRYSQHRTVSFPRQSGKVFSSHSKNNYGSSASDLDRDKVNTSDGMSGQGDLHSRKSRRYKSKADPDDPAFPYERSDVKYGFPDKSMVGYSESSNYADKRRSGSQWSSDSRMENKLKPREHNDFGAKSGSLCRKNGNAAPQRSLIQDIGGESKDDPIQTESGSWASKSFSYLEGECKQETRVNQAVPVSQQGARIGGLPVSASCNGDTPNVLKQPGNDGMENGAHHGMGHHIPDIRQVREFNASIPGTVNVSSQTANNVLKDAKDARDYADRLKSSGFDFESNEAYFQAALKFLHGASLLETCGNESGRHGDMNHMQVYSTAAKLCQMCALGYERRREMAAAALAYKCMEVAYMRVVYCKHSSSNRDRNELEATLQVAPQGESPSSSASDVDNLNNQSTVDKAALPKGNLCHAAGNHVIVARNRPNFVRVLDFAQNVNFAMEASRKSQNAFAAANVPLEDAQCRECITSIRKVIDFSFQDVKGLIRLVQLAMEAINRSEFGGARD